MLCWLFKSPNPPLALISVCWELHFMGFCDQAAPLGVKCRHPSTFICIVEILRSMYKVYCEQNKFFL